MKALERLKMFLSGKRKVKMNERVNYEPNKITSVSEKKNDEMYVKLEFLLENGRVFLKKFNKRSSEYSEWAHKKSGDKVTLLIRPDGIIKDIF